MYNMSYVKQILAIFKITYINQVKIRKDLKSRYFTLISSETGSHLILH